MSIGRSHVMASNQRLLRQLNKELFDEANGAWKKVYSEFCKRHGALMPNKVMQFKYKGEHYFLSEDVPLRGGIAPLDPSLVDEFSSAYAMFVEDLAEEKRVFQNMISHAIRIAKYAEDLLELLPECMHNAIHESGFFQMEDKPDMTIDQRNEFLAIYEEHFGMFDMRKTLGAVM